MANVMNFYDRALPAILVEDVKAEFGLNDVHIGVLSGAFIVVYAIAGIWLGRMADKRSRRKIMAWGLVAWSIMTAATGGAWGFISLLIFRLGVGIGEAAYAPAANSTISDLFPPEKRSRAVAIFQMGIPIGTILAFFTTAAIANAFDSFRAPFFLAAIPGLILAVALLRMKEPERGASEGAIAKTGTATLDTHVIRDILRNRTMRWLIVSGIGLQIVANSFATFVVPLFQRYFELSLTAAAMNAGIILGFSALLGLVVGGSVADRASRHSPRRRVLVGAVALLLSAPLALGALLLGPDSLVLFVVVFSLVSFLQFFFHTTAYPAVADVIAPAHRSTAIAVFFAAFYLLGGAFGPIVVGALSEYFRSNATTDLVSASAYGLNMSLLVMVPISLLLAAVGLFGAARTISTDHERMLAKAREEAV